MLNIQEYGLDRIIQSTSRRQGEREKELVLYTIRCIVENFRRNLVVDEVNFI